jgi:hypothetical protein
VGRHTLPLIAPVRLGEQRVRDLDISGEYERLHCARWTGPLPAWLG